MDSLPAAAAVAMVLAVLAASAVAARTASTMATAAAVGRESMEGGSSCAIRWRVKASKVASGLYKAWPGRPLSSERQGFKIEQ